MSALVLLNNSATPHQNVLTYGKRYDESHDESDASTIKLEMNEIWQQVLETASLTYADIAGSYRLSLCLDPALHHERAATGA